MTRESEPQKGNSAENSSRFSFLTRDGKLILAYLLLNSIPIGYMNVVPLVYLYNVGYDPAVIGIIYSVSAIANTIGLTPFGLLADKFGRKKFLIVGSAIPAISYAIFAMTLDPYWLIVASIIGGVGLAGGVAVAISGPALLPLVADSASDKDRTKLFGALQAVWTAALTIGSLLSLLPDLLTKDFSLTSFSAHSASYYFMAVLIVVSIVPILVLEEKRKSVGSKHIGTSESLEVAASASEYSQRRSVFSWLQSLPARGKGKLPSFTSGKSIAKFSLVYALSGLGLGVIVQLLPTWFALRYGTSESLAGLWIGLAELVSAASILMLPWLVRKRGTLPSCVFSAALSAVFLLLMPIFGSFYIAAVLFILRSVAINISWPILQSYMMGIVVEKERAAATGIATTAWGFANSIGTLVGGALLGVGFLSIPFFVGFVAYTGSSAALWFSFRGVKPPEEMK